MFNIKGKKSGLRQLINQKSVNPMGDQVRRMLGNSNQRLILMVRG